MEARRQAELEARRQREAEHQRMLEEQKRRAEEQREMARSGSIQALLVLLSPPSSSN